MRALVLAAGRGERLRPLTDTIAKPMIEVAGKPILRHVVDNLKKHGVKDILANIHYFHNQIVDYFKDELVYSYEETLLDTAGAIKKVGDWLGHRFLVVNGDTLTNVDITEMIGFHHQGDRMATIFTHDTATHNGGTFIFNQRVLDFIPEGKPYSIHRDLLPDLMAKGIPLNLYQTKAYYFDTANLEKLETARRFYEEAH